MGEASLRASPRGGVHEKNIKKKSAEAIARLMKKKRKALDTFLLKVGVLFGVNCEVTRWFICLALHQWFA